MKLIKLPVGDDPYEARIESLRDAIKEDPEYIGSMLSMMIEYCKEFSEDAYYALPNLERKLEEAKFWCDDWLEHED